MGSAQHGAIGMQLIATRFHDVMSWLEKKQPQMAPDVATQLQTLLNILKQIPTYV